MQVHLISLTGTKADQVPKLIKDVCTKTTWCKLKVTVRREKLIFNELSIGKKLRANIR